MKIETESIIRIHVSEIAKIIKKHHGINVSNVSPEIIGDYLVFQIPNDISDPLSVPAASKKRKSRKKRNRTRTRGWKVLGKVKADSGVTANVYEPFYNALKDRELSRKEQYDTVEKIIKSNDNKPNQDTIEYFLSNTLKYIREGGLNG